MTYRTEIDGLRAIAVLSVIIAHSGLGWMTGGYAGVDVFFVISGFLITTIIYRGLEQGTFTFREFYTRRARRIFPALFFMLVVVLAVGWLILSPSQVSDLSASSFFSVLFLSNLYFIDYVNYFAPGSDYNLLLHTWSLGIEEQFYVLFPLIAFLAYRFLGLRVFIAVVFVLFCASFLMSEWGWRNEPRANYFFSLSRFWEILLGSLAAFWCYKRDVKGNEWLAALGIAMLFLCFFLYDEDVLFPSYHTLLPTVGSALVLMFARDQTWVARALQFTPLRAVGLISFSAYLWHQPIFVFARLEGYDPSSLVGATVFIGLILIISTLSWRFVEQPFRTPSQGSDTWKTIVLSLTAVGILAVSLLGYYTKLPLLRFSAEDRLIVEVGREEAADYQREIGRGYERRAFDPDDPRLKVAFVGDSYGRDLMNIMAERGILQTLDLSFWQISWKCAPFYLIENPDRLSELWDIPHCHPYDRYETPEMLGALEDADIIVLASAWYEWQLPYVEETIENVKALSDATIILVGTKDFTPMSTRELLRMTPEERLLHRSVPDQDFVGANEEMKDIEGVQFIDLFAAICDPDGACPQVTPDGQLISEDGSHLTQAGAIYYGEALDGDGALSRLFSRP